MIGELENFQDGKKMIYSNMGYNKYMTKHVEPNKYLYVRGGIIQKKSQYCKVENCYKISSYGIEKIERCLNHRLKSLKCKKHKENNMINVKRKYKVCDDSKIIYRKGYICENNKKVVVLKIIKKLKIMMIKIIIKNR